MIHAERCSAFLCFQFGISVISRREKEEELDHIYPTFSGMLHFLGCVAGGVVDGLGEQVLQRHKFPVKIKVVGVQPSQNARCRV